METLLSVQSVGVQVPVGTKKQTLIHSISFELHQGEFMTIVGPSGSGKSTLLRVIAGLLQPTVGSVHWSKKPEVSFVFQHFALFPQLSVFENVAFGLRMEGKKNHEVAKIVLPLLDEVGLSEVATKHPKELSGGMRQRVGIARALAVDPDVLLLDEPFSALDEFTAEKLRELLLTIWERRKMSVLMVTHLVREALELSDRIIVMTPGPGTIEAIIKNTLKRPRNLRSTDFFTLEDTVRRYVDA